MSGSLVPDSVPVQAAVLTADVIAFPVRLIVAELPPVDRLTQALASLNAAMLKQQAALAAWRSALGALQSSTSGLNESLRRYQSSLATLSGNVDVLQHNAVSLEQWAEGVLAE